MVMKNLYTFQVPYLQILDEKGKIDLKLMPKLSPGFIIKMYSTMVLARRFDQKMLAMQRSGRISTFASIIGQEASTVGSAAALSREDFMVPSFRETAVSLWRGMPMENILLYYGGDERGSNIPEGENDLAVSVPVGTHTLHAVGIAYALRYQKKNAAVITYFGDGATSEGDIHEAMNFAGVFKLPVVFFCQNNQWAISVPREKQSAAKTLAQKAIAYGFSGIQVDGNDLFAVYKATQDALAKAKKESTPVMIESVTYRMSDHTTADDASRYRTPAEVGQWKKKDPLDRVKKYLMKKKLWDEKKEQELLQQCSEKIEAAVTRFEATPPAPVEDIFRYTYKHMIPELQEQLDSLKRFLKQQEGEGG